MEEISVKSIENMNKKKRSSKVEPITIMTEESRDNDQEEEKHEFPTLSSNKNILSLRCTERVSKLICQHILKQGEDEESKKNLVSVIHYCQPQNKITYDSYYIVKNIIYSILTK